MKALIDNLRDYLLDLPTDEYNSLNLSEETLGDDLLKGAIEDGIAEYDLVLPLSTTLTTALEAAMKADDKKLWYLVKQFAACNALDRYVIVDIRNRNPVNDSGFQVDEHGKAPDWKALTGEWRQRITKTALMFKRSLAYRGFAPEGISGFEPSGSNY